MEDSNPEVVEETEEQAQQRMAEEVARAREGAIALDLAIAEREAALEQTRAKEEKRLATLGKVTIGRMVEYRSRTGNYSVPAVVNCTIDSIYQPGVEAGNVPALSSADRVHLTVFTPGKPGLRTEADDFVVTSDEEVSENVAGCYQEWNIPYDPDGGPGTWKWPERV